MKSKEVTSYCTRLGYTYRETCFSVIQPLSTAGPDVDAQPEAPENSFCCGKTGKCSARCCFMINGIVALSQRPREWVIAATASPYYKSQCTPSHIVEAHHVGVCFYIADSLGLTMPCHTVLWNNVTSQGSATSMQPSLSDWHLPTPFFYRCFI